MISICKQHPKIVLSNANVLTMDLSQPRAECIAISAGTIFFVGSKKDLENTNPADFEYMDCSGRTILPGFIDAHCHLRAFAESLVTLDLRKTEGFSSIADIRAALRNTAQKAAPGTWIRGLGYKALNPCAYGANKKKSLPQPSSNRMRVPVPIPVQQFFH